MKSLLFPFVGNLEGTACLVRPLLNLAPDGWLGILLTFPNILQVGLNNLLPG